MPLFFCRITCPEVKLRPVFEKYSKLIAYEHNEDALNIHTHFLVETDLSTDTMKNWVRKLTGMKFKATDWSFKTKYKPHKLAQEIPVTEGCITYMAKGKLEPCYNNGYKAEDIEDYKLKWIDYKRSAKQQALTSYIVKESSAQSKLRQDEMIKEIIKRMEATEQVGTEQIIKIIRQVVIIENKTMLGRYKLRDYYDTIIAHHNPQGWLNKMATMVEFKTFS